MLTFLTVLMVLVAIAMIAIILLQRGAGATTGAAFGSGASGTVFGARGAASFLTRATGVLATLFFAIALSMAVMVSRGIGLPEGSDSSVMDGQSEQTSALPIQVDGAENGPGSGDAAFADDLPAAADTPAGARTGDLPAVAPQSGGEQSDDEDTEDGSGADGPGL